MLNILQSLPVAADMALSVTPLPVVPYETTVAPVVTASTVWYVPAPPSSTQPCILTKERLKRSFLFSTPSQWFNNDL